MSLSGCVLEQGSVDRSQQDTKGDRLQRLFLVRLLDILYRSVLWDVEDVIVIWKAGHVGLQWSDVSHSLGHPNTPSCTQPQECTA